MSSPHYDSAPDARAWAEVDLAAVRSNVRALASYLSPARTLMSVVKADAYGHGLAEVARVAVEAGASWLGVATAAEGAALRAAGLACRIALLCSPASGEATAVAENELTPMVGDRELAAALGAVSAGLEVHLDIDTGMGRSGVLPEDSAALWRRCRDAGLAVTGVCTHFSDAGGDDSALTELQWQRFAQAREALAAAGARFQWVHAANSAATLHCSTGECNLVRPGLLMYGIAPCTTAEPAVFAPDAAQAADQPDTAAPTALLSVRPALTLRARVGAVRSLPAGQTISYGATHRLTRDSCVATVLIGYGDGYPRRLSGCGHVLLRGRRAPILGRVCMDQTVVDVTDIPGVRAGDAAVCIGSEGTETITIEEIARRIGTTEHEVTTCLTNRIPRIFIEGRPPRPGAS
jgi:alanine racemase